MMVPTDPGPEGAPDPVVVVPSRRHRAWAVPLAAIGLLVPVATAASSMVLVDGYADAPGSADDVESRLEFTSLPAGVTVDDSDGEIMFVTVSTPHLSALAKLLSRYDDDVEVETFEQRFGRSNPTQEREIALQLMRDAKDVAEYVAYTRLGFGGELRAGEVVVSALVCRNGAVENDPQCDEVAPAGEFLTRGTTIVAVDGVATPTLDDLGPVMAAKRPGDVVTVRYRPPRREVELEADITTIAAADDPTRPLIGFVPHDTYSVVLPFEASIDTNRIGGPSAGLAFTLTLIDALTPGSLTGGRQVAVTGTIAEDGRVGAIGGLRQKAVAVAQAGGDYFIVPVDQGDEQLAEARAAVGDELEIVPVATLDEALAALVARGGERVPLAATAPVG